MPGGRGRKATPRGGALGGGPAPQQQLDWRPLKAREAECPVCRCTLSQPARLPCGHRFCLGCVQAAVLHSAGCCPLCRVRCAGWLRRATLNQTLVDEPLWEYIQNKFPAHLATRASDSHNDEDIPDSQTDQLVRHQLCAPGEIQKEFQAELEKFSNERRLSEEEKYSKVNEKVIRELQEQEKLELEAQSSKLKEDEKLARELSISLNNSVTDSQSTSNQSANNSVSKEFYKHLGKTSNGFKPKPMDRYVSRSNVKPTTKKNSPTMTATSPELVSTAGRCGRFLRNFLNGRLWGFNADSEDAHSSTSTKIEPKLWEPQKICSNGDRELSVNSGIVIQRNPILPKTIKLKTILKNTFKPIIDSDIDSEDSITQEIRYFKPIRPSPVCRFNGKLVRTIAVKNVINDLNITNKPVPDKLLTVTALEKLRGVEISNLGFNSAFVCYLAVPESHIKVYKNNPSQPSKSMPKKSNNKNSNKHTKTLNSDEDPPNNKSSKSKSKNDSPKKNGMKVLCTPKKTSLMTTRSNKLSQSFPKQNVKSDKIQSRVSSRLKRSISFNDGKQQPATFDNVYTNGDINDKDIEDDSSNCTNNKYHRKLRNNGHSNRNHTNGSAVKKVKTTHFHNGNGDVKSSKESDLNFPLNDIDPSVLQEQKRIEEMIAQEKKDLALAKKLQRQLGGQVINTGYTLRTAAKRQATLTELMPPAKNMRI